MFFDGGRLFKRVNAGREVVGEDDAERDAVFDGAQLLERFGLLKTRWRPGDELKEKTALEAINPQVPVVANAWVGIADEREGGAGEVKGIPFHIKDDFDDVRVGDLGLVMNGCGGGDHAHLGLAPEDDGEFINEGRGNEGLVPLDIDDGAVVRKGTGGLGDAVGAAGVVRGGEDGAGTESGGGLGDAFVIGGDDDVIHLAAVLAALPHMLHEGFPGDEVERLAWESGGSPAGRYGYKSALVFWIRQGG